MEAMKTFPNLIGPWFVKQLGKSHLIGEWVEENWVGIATICLIKLLYQVGKLFGCHFAAI